MHTIALLTLLFTGSLSLTGCRPAQPTVAVQPQAPETQEKTTTMDAQPPAVYRKLSAREAKEQLEKDPAIKLVDVRTEAEYRERRIANSLLIPDYEIEKLAPKLLPNKEEKLFLYCRSGRRSRAAALKLLEMGYTNVYDFGGILDWPYETVSGK